MSLNITNNSEVINKQELDLIYLLGVLFDRRHFIIGITLFFGACASFYAFIATPVYTADALIQIENKQSNGLLKSLSQISSGLSPEAEPEMILMKSRMVLGKTVEDLRLNYKVKPRWFPIVGKICAKIMGEKPRTLIVAELQIPKVNGKPAALTLTNLGNNRFRIDGEKIQAEGEVGKTLKKDNVTILVTSLLSPKGSQFSLSEISKAEAINALSGQFTVTEVAKQSGVLRLSLTGTEAELIAKTLNSIVDNYLQQNIARQSAQDAQSLKFLNRYMPQIRDELDQAEEKLNSYRQQRDSVDLSLEAKTVLEQIVNVDNQLNEITFREAEISQHFKRDHPTYRALLDKRQILEETKKSLTKKVAGMPTTQQEIFRLSRNVDTGRAIYLQLLTRQQELNLSRSGAIGNARSIDKAQTEPEPIKPKKLLIVVVGILSGLFFSSAIVLINQALHRGIETPEQLEALGITVLAMVPRSVWLWKETRLCSKNFLTKHSRHKIRDVPFLPVVHPHDLFVEAIRGLRTSLHFTMMDASNHVVMISGSTPNCGKTLISTSLAAIIAQAGQKVLFIDADMRKGYVHEIFSLTNQCGLVDILTGTADHHEAIQRYAAGEIDVITAGIAPLNPAELLMSQSFQALLSWADERYDMVIVDTPPILAVTDASLIGQMASTTLLVARHRATGVKEMQICVKRLLQNGVSVKGVVLNDVVKSAALYYGSGYSDYGYTDASGKKR